MIIAFGVPEIGLLLALAAVLVSAAAVVVSTMQFLTMVSPEVVVYVEQDEEHPAVLNLVVTNIGKGPARSVRLTADKEIEVVKENNVLYFGNQPPPPDSEILPVGGPFTTEIPFLPPGGKRVIRWGTIRRLIQHIGQKQVHVRADYLAVYGFWSRPRELSHTSTIEAASFSGCSTQTGNLYRIATNIAELKRGIHDAAKAVTDAAKYRTPGRM